MRKITILLFSILVMVSCSANTGRNGSHEVTKPEDLEGCTAGCIAGSLVDLNFEELCPGAIKQVYNNSVDLLTALDNGRVQFTVEDTILVLGIDPNLHPIEPLCRVPDIDGDIAAAFRKSDAALCAQFNEFLAGIKADGTYGAMRDRWISDKYTVSEMPEIETFTEGQPLVVGTMVQIPCFFIKNGEWVGFEAELMKRFAAYLHRPLEVEAYDFSALMASLKTGVINVWCSFITVNEERSKEVLFSDPYYFSPVMVFRKATASQAADIPFYKKVSNSFNNNILVEDRWKMLLDGLWETIVISFFSLLFGSLLGALICLLRMSGNRFLSNFAKVYVEILRGVPMLVLLMVMFYLVLSSTGLSGRWVAVISFAINFSAYACEIFRTGIGAIDKGQTEAGLAMGFTRVGTFFNFIVPQALKNILPVFKNEAVSLIKGTSIVGYVAIQDLTKTSDMIRARTFDPFFPLIIISIIYFFLAWLFGKALDRISKKIA